MATAKPTPRRTWPTSAVRPAPPGRRIGSPSVPPTGSAGRGRAAVSRMHRATGATLSTTWPVIRRSPVRMALRSRISTGSRPQAAASLSIWPSWAKHACTTPKPRMAPHGGLLVRTAHPSTTAFSQAYGPLGVGDGVHQHGRRGGGVGAAVEQEAGLDLHDAAVGGGVVAHPDPRRVAVDVAEEALLPAVLHLHRPAGAQGQQAAVHLQADVLPGAEGTADAAEHEADPLGVEPEAGGHLLAVLVQPLGGDVELHPGPARIGEGDGRLEAQEGLVLHPDLVGALDHHRPGGVGVAPHDALVAEHVAVGVDGPVRRRPPRPPARPAGPAPRTRPRWRPAPAGTSRGGRRPPPPPARRRSGPRPGRRRAGPAR